MNQHYHSPPADASPKHSLKDVFRCRSLARRAAVRGRNDRAKHLHRVANIWAFAVLAEGRS